MSRLLPRSLSATLALLALTQATPAAAQVTVGVGANYLGYAFDDGLGAEAAQLLMIPVGVRIPATDALTFDVSGAWAEGRIERAGSQLRLSGFVDTGVRAAYQATPWGLVTLGMNIPTGNAQHDGEEAIVASLLSTDLLGFREASWGRGLAITSSVAVARSFGSFGLGLAGAYSVRGKFNPSAEQTELEYRPGSEARVRVGVDRNFGNSTLTLGGTFINYTKDQADGRNLFKAGNRYRFDASYAWRMGAGVWTFYAADLLRANGDLTLEVLDSQGASQGFTDVETPRQNLAVVGLMGAVGIGGGFVFRPHLDFKLQTREDAAGSDDGSGWLVAAGGDLPMRIFGGYDFFPKARVILGSIKASTGEGVGVFGMEFTGTVRASF
ncbi:MAG TPA: hypothetical protein VMM35_09445 [Longimicrobiales bacterium]|nr:hypothetical protein [Longimicrobiales bacterium]